MEEQGDRTGEAGPGCTWQEGRSLSEEVQVAWRTRGVAYILDAESSLQFSGK